MDSEKRLLAREVWASFEEAEGFTSAAAAIRAGEHDDDTTILVAIRALDRRPSPEPSEETVERVARALCECEIRRQANKPFGFIDRVRAAVDERWIRYAESARAAIAAMKGNSDG